MTEGVYVKLHVNIREGEFLQNVKNARLSVWLALAAYVGKGNKCWPSLTTLEQVTGYNRTTVIRAIQWLEKQGYISVWRVTSEDNWHKSNTYILNGYISFG